MAWVLVGVSVLGLACAADGGEETGTQTSSSGGSGTTTGATNDLTAGDQGSTGTPTSVTHMAPGVWTADLGNDQFLSFKVGITSIVERTDLVYRLSDGSADPAVNFEPGPQPVPVGGMVNVRIEDAAVLAGSQIPVIIYVDCTLSSSTAADCDLRIIEGIEQARMVSGSAQWRLNLPTTGPIRDGQWEASTETPKVMSITFEARAGQITEAMYFVADPDGPRIGTVPFAIAAEIGSTPTLTVPDLVELNLSLDGYMNGSGDATFTGARTQSRRAPVELQWNPFVPLQR